MNKGMKVKSHKLHVTPQSNKLEDMEDKFKNELKQYYVVEIPHADPQIDEHNKVFKVKRVVCLMNKKIIMERGEHVGLSTGRTHDTFFPDSGLLFILM